MHKPAQKTIEQIERCFVYHPPFGDQATRYRDIREGARLLARLMSEACPESRELALALTSLQQAVMWANSAIAIHEVET